MGEIDVKAYRLYDEEFRAMKGRMQEHATRFRNLAETQISDSVRQKGAMGLADLLLTDDWRGVFAAGTREWKPESIRGSDSIAFEPGHWPEVGDTAVALHSAI